MPQIRPRNKAEHNYSILYIIATSQVDIFACTVVVVTNVTHHIFRMFYRRVFLAPANQIQILIRSKMSLQATYYQGC